KLLAARRLVDFPAQPQIKIEPSDAREWAYEALAAHQKSPLDAVLVSLELRDELCGDEPCCWMEAIADSTWWKKRSTSIRLKRKTENFVRILKVPIQKSNSFIFIDPYLNPTRDNYLEFDNIFELLRHSEVRPLIEFHRVVRDGSGAESRIINEVTAKEMFTT